MTPYDQAKRYLAKIPPAISGSGGHGATYHAAAVLVEGFGLPMTEARQLLAEYAARCVPPWNEREIEHKLSSVKTNPAEVGKMLRKSVRFKIGHTDSPTPAPTAPTPKPASPGKVYDTAKSGPMPQPMPDGARAFIRAAFKDGEGIQIAAARTGDDAREVPKDSGVVLTREEWLRKLDSHKGDPNGFISSSEKNGIFIRVNPMKPGGSKDADVTAYRHALLEFDTITQAEQWAIIQASRIPCTAVISSGGKSIHAWVRVDAANRQEYDERVKAIYAHFSQYNPDEKNKNPSRFSRLPFCERGTRRQELLSLAIGCESFAEWTAEKCVDGIGEIVTVDDLDAYDPKSDDSLLLGNDWLCRSESALLVGPSGVGKSSLAEQMVISWCVGLKPFGITAVRPLKVLVLQAENTKRYLKKSLTGIRQGLKMEPFGEQWDMLRSNLIFVRDTTHTGQQFVESLRRLIDRHRPDLVVVDPLLSFLGGDINKVEVVSQFCRTWINPILESANIAALFVHHTGKPPSDAKAKKHWQITDFSYSGLGSSELTNWARAICTLQACGQGLFRLIFSKRTHEAGAIHPSGEPAQSIWLKHATQGIFWEQSEPPEESRSNRGENRKPTAFDEINLRHDLREFLSGGNAAGESLRSITKRLEGWLGTKKMAISNSTCRGVIERLASDPCNKLAKNQDCLYVQGPNA